MCDALAIYQLVPLCVRFARAWLRHLMCHEDPAHIPQQRRDGGFSTALHDSSEHHQARLAPRLCSPRSFRSRRQSHTPAPSKIVVAVPCTPCAAARACHAVRRATSPRLGSLKPSARRAAAGFTPHPLKPPPSGRLFLGSKPDAVCPPLTLCLEVASRLVRGLVCAHCNVGAASCSRRRQGI